MTVEEWFLTEFWPTYPSDLTHNKKGPRSVALKSMIKLNPDLDLRQDIMNKLRVLIRSARKEKTCGQEPDRWCFASTWINQERWLSVEDMKLPSTIVDKRLCSCGKPIGIVNECWDCHDDRTGKAQKRRKDTYAQLCSIGLPKLPEETNQEYYQKCREWRKGKDLGSLYVG